MSETYRYDDKISVSWRLVIMMSLIWVVDLPMTFVILDGKSVDRDCDILTDYQSHIVTYQTGDFTKHNGSL